MASKVAFSLFVALIVRMLAKNRVHSNNYFRGVFYVKY